MSSAVTAGQLAAEVPNPVEKCPECWIPFASKAGLLQHKYTTHDSLGLVNINGVRVFLERDINMKMWCPVRRCKFSCLEEDDIKNHCHSHQPFVTGIGQLWPNVYLSMGSWRLKGCPFLTTPEKNTPEPTITIARTATAFASKQRPKVNSAPKAPTNAKFAATGAPPNAESNDWLEAMKSSTLKAIYEVAKESMDKLTDETVDVNAVQSRIKEIATIHNIAVENMKRVG